MRSIIAGSLTALALCGPAFAGPIVDGSVADWGITVGDGNSSDFSSPAVANVIKLYTALEDNNDLTGDSGVLGPHAGGQNYDVEFMGVAIDSNSLYIAIVTGQRPDNGFARFSPGDIRIVADNGSVYGIEVGGGAGGVALAGLLTEDGGAAGSTYGLNANGFTVDYEDSARTVGSIWKDPSWLLDPIASEAEVQMEVGGTQVGTANFVYTRNADPTTQHSVIELSIDRGIFVGASELNIYWAPSCNNDVLEVNDDLPGRVPEPGTLGTLAAGLLALRWVRRRR
ncbi:MAG: PEP-CTERM sorting domain-containing protein [Burkholderiales bacterium]